ncbi:MAG: FHA domain-containing protein [Anaerolineaceae bacterium]|nr:FHA domain-containing protein [Anaerolineaceae bacterium]
MFDYPRKPKPATQSPRFKLRIGSGRPIMMDLEAFGWLLVGRKTEKEDDEGLGLDLTPFGGLEKGVSRNHAAFSYMEGGIYIEDLGSTSGTRVNGLPLKPNQKYHLRHNDEIEFGSVRVVVVLN